MDPPGTPFRSPSVLCWLALSLLLALPAPAATPFRRGDSSGDGIVDISDPVITLLYLFAGKEAPVPLDALDSNDDGTIDLTDALHTLRFLFQDGAPPAPPFPEPGLDPTATDPYTEGDPRIIRAELSVRDLYVDPEGFVTAVLASAGPDEVPAGVLIATIHVDGLLVHEARLDGPFPPGTVTVRTAARAAGSYRRLAAVVDPLDQVLEPNEIQQSRLYTLTPPAIEGPDIVVSELRIEGGALRIIVANRGSRSSRNGLAARIAVRSDLQAEAMEFAVELAAIAPGGTATIDPSPPVAIAERARVRVSIEPVDPGDEIDTTNDVLELVLPDGPDLAPYEALLDSERILRSIVWEGSGGIRNYELWTQEEKNDLVREILELERFAPGSTPPLPALVDGSAISAADAWTIFLRHVAHALWVEVHRLVDWRLEEFPDDQLAYLLDGRKLLYYVTGMARYRFDIFLLGNVTAWSPHIAYEFLATAGCIRPTQRETVLSLTDWMRGYLIHTSSSDRFSELYGYAGPPPVDRVLYSLRSPHKTAGCWGTSGLYAAVLRAVNIPVAHGHTLFGNCRSADAMHSRPEFPSLGLSLPHGDDPYSSYLRPQGAVVPSEHLFYTLEELQDRFLAPSVECAGGGSCNSVGSQALVNSSRDHLRLASDWMTDYLLYTYAQDGPQKLDDALRGFAIGGEIVECARPLFPSEERAQVIAAVEGALRELGQGDLELGKGLVRARVGAFGANLWP